MRRIINIDGKDVPFAASAATVIYYRNTFNADLIRDFNKLNEQGTEQLSTDVVETFSRLAYTMAKQANSAIPETVEEWLDSFDVFPIQDIFPEISDLWAKSLGTTVIPKK